MTTQARVATQYQKPLPSPDQDSKPYWELLRKHEFSMQRCAGCGKFRFPPRLMCPHCSSLESTWTRLSGKGKVYSHTTFHHVYGPAWADEVPYNVSMIELEEGVRMYSNVIGCKPEEVYVGMPVELVYEDVTEEYTLPKFKPASS